ncbi:MAG: 2-keto-4-pentenoate hydratase [Candidatus Competibacterales bacterium]
MSTFAITTLADEMQIAQKQVRQITPFTDRYGDFANGDAYRLAGLIHQRRVRDGAKPVGRKIGFTNASLWPVYGVYAPIWGYVYDTTVEHLVGGEGRCRVADFAEPRIEPEIVLHFTSSPADATPEAILAAVDWIAHGIEIVQTHFPSWRFKAADSIASNALHGRLLVGPPKPVVGLGSRVMKDLERVTLMLACDGKVRDEGQGANVLGSPLKAVAHLLDTLANQPDALPLQGGELVTTGSLTQALPIHPGEHWTTTLMGMGLSGLSLICE